MSITKNPIWELGGYQPWISFDSLHQMLHDSRIVDPIKLTLYNYGVDEPELSQIAYLINTGELSERDIKVFLTNAKNNMINNLDKYINGGFHG